MQGQLPGVSCRRLELTVASFCAQCSVKMFNEDFRDFANMLHPEDAERGLVVPVICEGCGATFVDQEGKCVDVDCLEGHGDWS